jgi:hypothetical protein
MVCHVVVWDGVRDFQSLPNIDDLEQAGDLGRRGVGKLVLARAHGPCDWSHIAELVPDEGGAIILWTRDHAIYTTIAANLERDGSRMM